MGEVLIDRVDGGVKRKDNPVQANAGTTTKSVHFVDHALNVIRWIVQVVIRTNDDAFRGHGSGCKLPNVREVVVGSKMNDNSGVVGQGWSHAAFIYPQVNGIRHSGLIQEGLNSSRYGLEPSRIGGHAHTDVLVIRRGDRKRDIKERGADAVLAIMLQQSKVVAVP